MADDLKAAFRALRSSKTFTAVALAVLALGIGASTAIFSVVDTVVLRGLPFDEHDRLVAVGQRSTPAAAGRFGGSGGGPQPDPQAVSSFAPQNYIDLVAQQQVFESISAVAGGNLTLREPGAEPEEIRAQRVTASFFTVLRSQPVIGRAFTAENENDGQHQVAVLSDGLWRRRFGADPAIVGRTIPLEGGAYTVLGVMAPDFEYPIGSPRPTEIFVPYVVPPNERVRDPRSFSIYLQSVARLKPGVSVAQAQANMDQIAKALTQANPEWNKDTLFGVRPLHDHIVGARTTQWMLMLLGAVGIVLLIACANVANLLLARASEREREVGIRAALGAGRWQLMRQLMTENLVLAVIGTALALVLAWWGISVIKTAIPDGVPRVSKIAIDLRVLGAAAVIALVTGLLFGIVPAFQLSRPDLTNALKEGARGASSGRARRRLRSALVVVEVALAVVLLVGAALFIGSFRTLMHIDPGFNPDHVLTASVQPRIGQVTGTAQLSNFANDYAQIIERLSSTPGVTQASVISGGMPLGGAMSITTIAIPGRTLTQPDNNISIRRVTADYHKAIGLPLTHGRLFTNEDRDGSAPVVIINESAAKKYFPGENAVGKTVTINGDRTIVGVVGDIYQTSLETAPRTEAYVPVAQGRTLGGDLIIRTAGDPYTVLPAVRTAVLAVLPDVPLRNVRSMNEVIARQVAQRRFNMLLLGLFGVLGLVISAVGIYGVMAYVVAQREREIGVRMALGASRGAVVGMILQSAAILVAIGLVIGGIAAWSLGGTAKAFLFKIDVADPRVYATAIGVLVAAALVASVIPARRAASVDPLVALRAE
ncbi:MAG TPA: ABC transporter permease [Vicinamibacterales bacterium]|nr:ABC transporter permease [Vicinamibacterales bacterium]